MIPMCSHVMDMYGTMYGIYFHIIGGGKKRNLLIFPAANQPSQRGHCSCPSL